MSFSVEKREQIKRYILEKIESGQPDTAKRTAEAFCISLNTVYRYIRELREEQLIQQNGKAMALTENSEVFILNRADGQLENEDIIYKNCLKRYVDSLADNVKKIWEYSFMEMMNNAIEHSEAEIVGLLISVNYLNTKVIIKDNGVGIFRKIKEYYHYSSLDDAVNELFKGKLTTDSERHSGEGIFFTSRILDRFAAISDGKVFSHDKYSEITRDLEEISSIKHWKSEPGTIIYMEISNFSKKVIKEVFDMFSDEEGSFVKTQIPLKNIYETYPVSRSQAKRLYNRFNKFQEVELDFEGVEEIGQGFAHEIFVVFQKNHPETEIISVNANETVQRMINHVLRS